MEFCPSRQLITIRNNLDLVPTEVFSAFAEIRVLRIDRDGFSRPDPAMVFRRSAQLTRSKRARLAGAFRPIRGERPAPSGITGTNSGYGCGGLRTGRNYGKSTVRQSNLPRKTRASQARCTGSSRVHAPFAQQAETFQTGSASNWHNRPRTFEILQKTAG